MADDKRERWALRNGYRGDLYEVDSAGGESAKLIRVEKSFTASKTRAAFIGIEGRDDDKYANLHLSADGAEGIATVLLFLADKWRKENT